MTLLILGGTSEGRQFVRYLNDQSPSLVKDAIYSIAGLVDNPTLPCDVISGGFSQFGGLSEFVRNWNVSGIVDLTHPYAVSISASAKAVAHQCGLPYWRYQRPAWVKGIEDHWLEFDSRDELLGSIASYHSVFFSVGRMSESDLSMLHALNSSRGQIHCVRTVVPAPRSAPEHIHWLTGKGPFSVEDEVALFQRYQIDALVSKNSGGKMTQAKLMAARQLKIPVLMLRRPEETQTYTFAVFENIYDCADAILTTTKTTERA